MQYTIPQYKRELKLTIENTEELYKKALDVSDFDWRGDEIESLYITAWAQINENMDENVAPTLYTDHDVHAVKSAVASVAWALQIDHEERLS